jgi:signal transduction histidine kinase
MTSKAELQKRIAELEAAQAKAAALYALSARLNAASDEDELLQALAQPALEAGAIGAYLLYIDLDEAGEPEWVELVAALRPAGANDLTIPLGTRFNLSEFSLTQLWLVSPNELLLVSDSLTDERVDEKTRALLIESGFRAMALIPLARAGRWVGTLNLHWAESHQFSQQEVEIYHEIINLATPAVESRRLLVEKERTVVEKLFKISRGLNTARDTTELLQILARPGVEAGANRAYLSYIDLDETGQPEWVEIVASWWQKGADPMPIGSRFYLPTFPFARLWIANPNEPQLISEVLTNQQVDEASRNFLAQRGTPATAIIPLAQAGRWVGIVGLAWETPHNFSKQEIEIYRALMGLGTQAVENQRLFQNLEKLVEERTRELQSAQERLLRQEKLAYLGQLAGGVGHELRNPLGVVANAVYFLKMVLADADETVKEYLELISGRVAEAEQIITALLNLSRIKPGAKERVAVSTLVAETLQRYPPPAQVTVVTQLASNLPPVLVDTQQISLALSNLVTNAYQALPHGDQVVISAQVEGERVRLSVADSGVGIPAEVIAKIFEPLFTTKAKGIGLGLAVSKNLVEMNGGTIEVESVQGQGSTFRITLPVTKPPEA